MLAATVDLDYEAVTSYELVLESRDQGTNPGTLTGTTTLSVLVNGKARQILNLTFNFRLSILCPAETSFAEMHTFQV